MNMENKFFNLIDPLTNYIDSGKFFRQPLQWLYYLLGGICAFLPLHAIYIIIVSGILKFAAASAIFAILLVWIILCGVCLLCFLLWFNRAKKLPELLKNNSKFIAVPAVANFIQTFGEFFGLFTGIFGFLSMLILTVVDLPYFFYMVPTYPSIGSAFTMLIAGYITVVATRYLAELVLSIADIANNTARIANK